ncbi:MAG: DEAD/DEAH box helicase family protein [Candidatus Odinarchaeota archaeon]|nr:DEAD/DEAH box helicase family protein [Candidatus Odinarchaeota archaeon]
MVEYFKYPFIKPNTVEKRVYQEVIAAYCTRKNTLVVLPTGLGKTIIAALVAAARLKKHPDSKIVFLAPTRPLVEQHNKVFQKIMDLEAGDFAVFTGQVPPKRRQDIWNRAKIVFMTPQILQNDLISNNYNIREVSLIIFDECHRAVGDYPYVFIAKKYVSEAENPLILGITASPGDDMEKIETIKKNLFIEQVEVRDERSPDVAPYIHKKEVKWISVDLPPEFLRIIKILRSELKDVLRQLKEEGWIDEVDPSAVKRTDILDAQKKIREEASREGNIGPFIESIIAVANAIRLSYLLELIETQGTTAFYEYLTKLEKKAYRSGSSKALRDFVTSDTFTEVKALSRTLIDRCIEHPKLERLTEILKEFTAKNKNSRILVFTHFRVTAKYVSERLEKEGFKVSRFVGQQKRGGEGMSQKEQLEILKRFADGEIQILVATSVAEEGLDIAECDLVVFYDAVPSAIRRIQRIGRTGRKRKGTVIILIAKGTRDEGYYWASVRKEQKMRTVLKAMSRMSQGRKGRSTVEFDTDQLSLDAFLKESNNKGRNQEAITEEEKEKIKIIADSREQASEVLKELSLKSDVIIEIQQLDVGDYILSDRVCVERKQVDDFLSSLIDSRLFAQIKNMVENYQLPILIIEGENLYTSRNISLASIRGALVSISTDFKVPILWSRYGKETAELLYLMAKREQITHKRSITIRGGRKVLTDSEILEFIVAGIPGIDRARAKQLLSYFKTLKNLFSATEDELVKVPQIGKRLAHKIVEISNKIYSSAKNIDKQVQLEKSEKKKNNDNK